MMASLFKEIFTWWDGNTWGTRLTIWRQGRFVGRDDFGNTYYEQRRGVGPLGRPRRWVTYRSSSDPSQVPAGWHGWLHYTFDRPPTEEEQRARPWEKPHRANLTGTPDAYRPPGSIVGKKDPQRERDYEAWRPE